MNDQAWADFQERFRVAGWTGSRSPRRWSQKIGACERRSEALPEWAMTRVELADFIAERRTSAEICALAILAWGGMRVKNGERLMHALLNGSSGATFNALCDQLCSGEITRKEAYNAFAALRRNDGLPGLGPAYFTKLIYFLHPAGDGYIMDQWTSLGVNLIGDERGVNFIGLQRWGAWNDPPGKRPGRPKGYLVADSNSGEVYERFCLAVETYGRRLGKKPSEVEQVLFSGGGRQPLPWRRYVRAHCGIS